MKKNLVIFCAVGIGLLLNNYDASLLVSAGFITIIVMIVFWAIDVVFDWIIEMLIKLKLIKVKPQVEEEVETDPMSNTAMPINELYKEGAEIIIDAVVPNHPQKVIVHEEDDTNHHFVLLTLGQTAVEVGKKYILSTSGTLMLV